MTNMKDKYSASLDASEQGIINIASQRLAQQLSIVNIHKPKNRIRSRKSIIVKGEKGRYFVELAKNDIQKFYLKRSIYYSKFFKSKIKHATVNLPVVEGEIEGVCFAVFPYIPDLPGKPDLNGEQILKTLYQEYSYVRKISDQSIGEIEDAFLNSWPKKYHHYIRSLPEYSEYFKQIQSYDEISLCPEHGDFALNNILRGMYTNHLIDFEFSRESQPVGFDLYAYRRTTYKTNLFWRKNCYYGKLHSSKFRLNNRINFAIDNDLSEIIVYPELSYWLRSKILDLVDDFCIDAVDLWDSLSSISKDGTELFFVTVWEGKRLSGFAAFKLTQNILYPITTRGDVPIIHFLNTYQLGLLIKYMERSGLGLHLEIDSKQSDVYNQFLLIKKKVDLSVNAASMPDVLKDKSKDPALFRLVHDISGYIESVVMKDIGSRVLIYNRRNRRIISKYKRNRFFAVMRRGLRSLRTGFFFMAQLVNVKRFLYFLYQYPKIRLRWRKSRKKGGALLLRVGDFHSFIKALNKNGVEYAVLRGLRDGNPSPDEDVDFMLKASHIQKIIRVAACFPGKIPCDIYFDTYQSVECYPYYPPAFAVKILERKVKNSNDCYVPDEYSHLVSLLYHITYHKGLTKGFDPDSGKITPESKYYDKIQSLIQRNNMEERFDLSLEGFHKFLKSEGVSMPYDLLIKWPKRNETIDAIKEKEQEALLKELPDDKGRLVVFIIREDAAQQDIIEYIKGRISDKFSILFFNELTESQIDCAIQFTRGGNWVELDQRKFHLVSPYLIVACQHKALDVSGFGEEGYVEICAKIKKEIRKYVNNKFPSRPKRYLIHSTDSPCEAIDYLKILYPQSYMEIISNQK